MRLVHDGKGRVLQFEDVAKPAPYSDGPRHNGFKLNATKFRARREAMVLPRVTAGNGYKPGPLLELGYDQCRFIINDENSTMCGKVGFPWCAGHKINVLKRYAR